MCAHPILRGRTLHPHPHFNLFSSIFRTFFSNFSAFLWFRVFKNRIRWSKTGKDAPKQEKMFWKHFFKTKSSIFWQVCPKKCAKVWSHIARPKKGRTRAHPAHFPEWISHAHAHVRPHIARVRARTHLRNSYLGKFWNGSLLFWTGFRYVFCQKTGFIPVVQLK